MNNITLLMPEIMKHYKSGLTCFEIAKMYNVSDETIRTHLHKHNVILRTTRKYFFNESAFSLIETQEQAYWLGFIFADGNVYKDELSIKLGVKDKHHLEKFKNFMEYTGEVTNEKYPRIRLYSPTLCVDLNRLGVLPNKTNNIQMPTNLGQLTHHFIRGFFDGDGWICGPALCFSSCSLSFIEVLRKVINTEVGRNCGSIIRVCRPKINAVPNYTLSYGGNVISKQVQEYMMKDATTYLSRKHKL